MTRPRVFQPPRSLDDALDQVTVWLGSPSLAVLAEGADPRESQAASLIAYLSLQDPRLLASDLDLLRDLGVNRGT